MVGYEPQGSLRELIWAAEERRSSHWDHTAELLANQINLAAKKCITSAQKIHPYRTRKPAVQKSLSLFDLVDFVD